MGRAGRGFWVVSLLLATASGCSQSSDTPGPVPSEFEGWIAGPSSEFVGDELFMLINGGAEIYHEYGFVSVDVQEWKRGEERYSIEIYTMTDDAFGIYSWARSDTGQPVDIGAGGTLADYYLHFWSGPNLVVVTAQNPGLEPRKAVLDLGEKVGSDYPRSGSTPEIIDLIPTDHCPQESATYFVGSIAFNNLAPRLAPWFEGFDDGVWADCPVPGGETERIVFLRWSDPTRAAIAIQEASRRLGTAVGARFETIDDTPPDGARIEFIDNETFTVIFDNGVVAAGWRADHILRVTVANGHRPKLDELPFWCEPSRRQS